LALFATCILGGLWVYTEDGKEDSFHACSGRFSTATEMAPLERCILPQQDRTYPPIAAPTFIESYAESIVYLQF
jgi:hypothetical protein